MVEIGKVSNIWVRDLEKFRHLGVGVAKDLGVHR